MSLKDHKSYGSAATAKWGHIKDHHEYFSVLKIY